MKRILYPLLFVIVGSHAMAQKDVVLNTLAKYKIDESILDPKLRDKPTDISYDLKESVVTEGNEKITLAHYDATKAEDQRWTVISVDDQDPTSTEIKRFLKEHGKPPVPPVKIDDSSYKIDKEDANFLVISFKLDPASLVDDNAFLKDCRSFLTINLKTGKMVKAEGINEKPLKIKIFNVSKLNTYTEFDWIEADQRYLPKRDYINMIIKILGQDANTTTIFDYSNFKK